MPGPWEGDLIKGTGNKSAVGVLVEPFQPAALAGPDADATAEAETGITMLSAAVASAGKIHLQLLRAFVADGDGALDGLFLLHRQGAVLAAAPTACTRRQAGQPENLKACNRFADRRVAQPHVLGNLRTRSPSLVRPDGLPTPLMLLGRTDAKLRSTI